MTDLLDDTSTHFRATLGEVWVGLRIGTTEDVAKAKFRAIYGKEPKEVKFTGGAVLVGPIVSDDEIHSHGPASN